MSGDYAIGQAVVLERDGEKQVGQVVGMSEHAFGMLYEVSLESVVAKGVWASELTPAAPTAIQATLAGLSLDEQVSHLMDDPTSRDATREREALRRGVLRQAYAGFLQRALAQATMPGDPLDDATRTRFAIGAVVALREGEAWTLGEVRRITYANGDISYEMEAMGECLRANEDELCPLGVAPPLGRRAYLVAKGHELDDDFAGTICRVERDGDAMRLALLFDDGDILTDLEESDLAWA